jgi:hypothetical protein
LTDLQLLAMLLHDARPCDPCPLAWAWMGSDELRLLHNAMITLARLIKTPDGWRDDGGYHGTKTEMQARAARQLIEETK